MKSKADFRRARKIGLIVFCLIISLIPPISGVGWPEEQTRHIRDPTEPSLDADWFVTETGIGFSSSLVTVLDPEMDIWAYLWFENMQINSYFYLINATLRLRTASPMEFDADSSITIYGIPDYAQEGSTYKGSLPYGSPASVMTSPLTSAYVTVNTSQFYGPQWWDIDVTNIVQELKSNQWYEGPGLDFSDTGSNMAFIIQGSSGYDTRYFYDVQAGNGFEAQLILHWDFNPPLPEGYTSLIFNETYGNYTIWKLITVLDPFEYVWGLGSAPGVLSYDDDEGAGPYSIQSSGGTGYSTQRALIRLSNGTLVTVYYYGGTPQIYVQKSIDDGATWTDTTRISTYGDMESKFQGAASIALGSNDSIHVAFHGEATGLTGSQIWYVKYNGSWQTPVLISTYAGMDGNYQSYPSIALDSNDNIYVAWEGKATGFTTSIQIWYAEYTDSWQTPIRISTYTDMDEIPQDRASIAIGTNDSIHISWTGATPELSVNVWVREYNGSWQTPIRISTYEGMDENAQGFASIALDSNDNIHVAFEGEATEYTSYRQIWYAEYNGSWQTPFRVSTHEFMYIYAQRWPSISVDAGDGIHILWNGKSGSPFADDDKIWHAEDRDNWDIPISLQPTGLNRYANLRWSMWPEGNGVITTYLVVDANGTVVKEDLDSYEDATDWIDFEDPDPDDPNPGDTWAPTGPFTRFKTRLYIFLMGVVMIWGPLMVFASRRPTGYAFVIGLFVMLIGFSFLIHAGTV